MDGEKERDGERVGRERRERRRENKTLDLIRI